MAASQALLLTHSDFVEVSGWDKNEIFFVEKAELSTDDAAKKYISLEHMLAEGAIVFVRAIQATVFHRPNPTAYETEFIGSDSQGHNQFRLNTARPRYGQRRYPVN